MESVSLVSPDFEDRFPGLESSSREIKAEVEEDLFYILKGSYDYSVKGTQFQMPTDAWNW